MIRGRWNGWRNVSSKAAARAGGLADEGSVLAETLEVLSGSMPRYADWLTEQIVIGNPQSILEVGAGTGTITECLARVGRVTAVEPASDSRAILERNTANLDNVSVVGRLEDCGPLERFDAIVLINVLEHIDTDVAFLTQLRDYLSPNGYIAVLSPAHNALYSKFDASIGHVRRYTRRRLELTLRHAGYRDANVRYFNFVGAFLWFAVNRLGGRSSATEGQTALYDRVIVPLSRAVDRIRIRPFGQSVVGVGRS
jgi:SAM-dependent methyltransferase